MSGFVDVYAPVCMRVIEKPVVCAPRWSVTINQTAGGNEQRNQNWEHPLWSFSLPEAVREQDHFEPVLAFWMGMGGSFGSFPWRNPVDFASRGLPRPNTAPVVARSDQAVGIGDGFTDSFQLKKTYAYETLTYTRVIHLPIVASVLIEIDGKSADDPTHDGGAYTFTVSRPGGVVTFDRPVAAGLTIRAGFLFDVEARFADDHAFQAVVRTKRLAGFSDVNLEEVRPC